MTDQQRSLLATGIVLVVILTIIIGSIYFVFQMFQGKKVTKASVAPSASVAPIKVAESTPSASARPSTPPNTKSYKINSLQIHYPKSWGLLTCRNSKNIEFDPTNSTDQLNVLCDVALKPITILVGSSNCQGQTIDLSGVSVVKSKTTSSNGVSYKWCTKTNPALEISHRVSSTGSRAASIQDFSAQIEQMIVNSFAGSNTK
ncbi:hypothetical protein HYS93_04990 [Candidatus Daviesbacteria bacterium]|nr:hypothetical protein [Candidatus Daviesbacteria bacterium]